ncbi:MAG: hypothetical protein H6708_06265 [Kofleriaceae bacterium]|nr:hypothetical protein [Kofleriaceae bacterium]
MLLVIVLGDGRRDDERDERARAAAPWLALAGPWLHVKGAGEIVVSLVRDRAGVATVDAAGAGPRDRLAAIVTCAEPAPVTADLVVFQRDGDGGDGDGGDDRWVAAFPGPPQPLRCGNRVVVPGAFRLTPGPTGRLDAIVCVAIDPDRPERAVDRAALARRGPHGPGLGCVAVAGDDAAP